MADTSWKVGDNYPQITFDFFQYLEEGGDSTKYTDKKYYNATIKYITPTGGLILETTDIEDMKTDDGMSKLSLLARRYKRNIPTSPAIQILSIACCTKKIAPSINR